MTHISDFPGGEGESKFVGRGSIEDILTDEGRWMYGFEKYIADPNKSLHLGFVEKVNRIISA